MFTSSDQTLSLTPSPHSPSSCGKTRETHAQSSLSLPGARGLEAQPHSASRPRSGSSLQFPAGPSCRPRVPGAATPSGQLRRASRSRRGLVWSGLRISEPRWYAAAAWGTRGAEGHHHGSPGSQNPEHAAGPQEGVGVSIKEILRRRSPFKLYVQRC